MRVVRLFFVAGVVLFPVLGADADSFATKETFNFDPTVVEQRNEVETMLPPHPSDADLVAIPLGPTDTLKVFVDTKSVSRAADRVLRLTLVVESPSGVRNVFFDGYRCDPRQYKTYAIGSAGKTLERVKNPQWQGMSRVPYNAFRTHLFVYYICGSTPPGTTVTPENFLMRVKYGPQAGG